MSARTFWIDAEEAVSISGVLAIEFPDLDLPESLFADRYVSEIERELRNAGEGECAAALLDLIAEIQADTRPRRHPAESPL